MSHTRANVLEGELKSVYPENDKPFRSWTKRVSSVGNPEKYDRVVGSLNYDLLVREGYIQED